MTVSPYNPAVQSYAITAPPTKQTTGINLIINSPLVKEDAGEAPSGLTNRFNNGPSSDVLQVQDQKKNQYSAPTASQFPIPTSNDALAAKLNELYQQAHDAREAYLAFAPQAENQAIQNSLQQQTATPQSAANPFSQLPSANPSPPLALTAPPPPAPQPQQDPTTLQFQQELQKLQQQANPAQQAFTPAATDPASQAQGASTLQPSMPQQGMDAQAAQMPAMPPTQQPQGMYGQSQGFDPAAQQQLLQQMTGAQPGAQPQLAPQGPMSQYPQQMGMMDPNQQALAQAAAQYGMDPATMQAMMQQQQMPGANPYQQQMGAMDPNQQAMAQYAQQFGMDPATMQAMMQQQQMPGMNPYQQQMGAMDPNQQALAQAAAQYGVDPATMQAMMQQSQMPGMNPAQQAGGMPAGASMTKQQADAYKGALMNPQAKPEDKMMAAQMLGQLNSISNFDVPSSDLYGVKSGFEQVLKGKDPASKVSVAQAMNLIKAARLQQGKDVTAIDRLFGVLAKESAKEKDPSISKQLQDEVGVSQQLSDQFSPAKAKL